LISWLFLTFDETKMTSQDWSAIAPDAVLVKYFPCHAAMPSVGADHQHGAVQDFSEM
jgi:hypothetical protein